MENYMDDTMMQDDAPVTQEEYLINEADILKALSNEDFHEEITKTIEINLGKTIFRFRVRPLTEKEWDECRERSTKYAKNRRLGGMRMPEKTDTSAYHTNLIYTATVKEDREKLWDNKKFWVKGIITGRDLVDRLIPFAGKKQQIVDIIEKLSGYDDEDDYEENVKN